MTAKKRPRRRPRRRPVDRIDSPLTVSRLWRIGAVFATLVAGTYATWTAWIGFGWWVPASVTLVDDHITRVVAPIAGKVDEQGASILSGRIETLRGARQLQVDAKSRLELASHTTKDLIAGQIIQGQQKTTDETIKGIDDQITELTAQLQKTRR